MRVHVAEKLALITPSTLVLIIQAFHRDSFPWAQVVLQLGGIPAGCG